MLLRGVAQPLAQVLDPSVTNAADGDRKKVPNRLETGGVGDVGRVRRDDELNRPRQRGAGTLLGTKLAGDLRDLADEHLLHLRMQVSLRLLDEHEVDGRGGRFGAESTVEADDLEQDEDEVAYSETGIGLGEQDPVMARISHLGVAREQAFDVERGLGFQFRAVKAGIAEGLQCRHQLAELLLEATLDRLLNVANGVLKGLSDELPFLIGGRRFRRGEEAFEDLGQYIGLSRRVVVESALGVHEARLQEGAERANGHLFAVGGVVGVFGPNAGDE